MSLRKTFTSPDIPLSDLLSDIHYGKIQIPDFQRGWIWDDEHIRSLLASISLSYPIGALMMLETGNENVRFKPRLLEGVKNGDAREPEKLILDGQQRLTSLYQSLSMDNPVKTKDSRGKVISRWYYLDMKQCLNPNGDREEAILSIPEVRKVKNFRGEVIKDFSKPEFEFSESVFPLSKIFDYADWRSGNNEFWDYERDKTKQFDDFEQEILKRFEQYQIPVIVLTNETPKEAVCQVFEKVNTGGVSLTVFELLTATFAADDFSLRDDWKARSEQLRKHKALTKVESTDFLQGIALLATYARKLQSVQAGNSEDDAPAVSCKRKDILNLRLEEYLSYADTMVMGFESSAQLLHRQNIYTARDIPYRTQVVPLAAIMASLRDQAELDGVKEKIAQWLWCGVLGELYGSGVESRSAKDLPEVLEWIKGGSEPTTISDANFTPARLMTLRTRNSAAYKGIHALLLREGALDFRTGDAIDAQLYFDERIDIHHIFPKGWCEPQGIHRNTYNSILNKTPISAKTNRIIGSKAPSDYLSRLESSAQITIERMDDIVVSHLAKPEFLRADNFDRFMTDREESLIRLIEGAMGKPVVRESFEEDAVYLDELNSEENYAV